MSKFENIYVLKNEVRDLSNQVQSLSLSVEGRSFSAAQLTLIDAVAGFNANGFFTLGVLFSKENRFGKDVFTRIEELERIIGEIATEGLILKTIGSRQRFGTSTDVAFGVFNDLNEAFDTVNRPILAHLVTDPTPDPVIEPEPTEEQKPATPVPAPEEGDVVEQPVRIPKSNISDAAMAAAEQGMLDALREELQKDSGVTAKEMVSKMDADLGTNWFERFVEFSKGSFKGTKEELATKVLEAVVSENYHLLVAFYDFAKSVGADLKATKVVEQEPKAPKAEEPAPVPPTPVEQFIALVDASVGSSGTSSSEFISEVALGAKTLEKLGKLIQLSDKELTVLFTPLYTKLSGGKNLRTTQKTKLVVEAINGAYGVFTEGRTPLRPKAAPKADIKDTTGLTTA